MATRDFDLSERVMDEFSTRWFATVFGIIMSTKFFNLLNGKRQVAFKTIVNIFQ